MQGAASGLFFGQKLVTRRWAISEQQYTL